MENNNNNNNNTPNKESVAANGKNLKIFLILLISAVVLAVGVALAVFLITREPATGKEYLPKDYGSDPSGIDGDYTGRY